MNDKHNKAVNTCRFWLQGKLYPNTSKDEFLSLLMGTYKLSPQDARTAIADAEWAEQFQDQPEIAGIAYR
jgi:hypothetical protein